MKYPIGTVYKQTGKRGDVCTVIDFLTTRNLAGEVVSERYVSTHLFMGQLMTNNDVPAASIARGLQFIPQE